MGKTSGPLTKADVGDAIDLLCQDMRCPGARQRILGTSPLPNGRRDAVIKCAVCKRTRRMILPPIATLDNPAPPERD